MSAARNRSSIRLALNQAEAADALGVCVNTFKTRIAPELACVHVGRRRLYLASDLQQWLEQSKTEPLE
jgi:hypothetical protein